LERDWGITTKEECLEMINLLFEAGKAADNKAAKARGVGHLAVSIYNRQSALSDKRFYE